MCGIAGIVKNSLSWKDQERLRAMLALLEHRGPDDEGVKELARGSVLLGHKRLKIIDLTDQAHQPMANEDETLWITYNGEIYNHLELMSDLKSKGHIFRSRSDTEVILHAYEEYGVDCLSRLNGMWAFALWDERRSLLFCARDRLGEKPFYYHLDAKSKEFVFASEMKAIAWTDPSCRHPDENNLRDFLHLPEMNHSESTFFRGIQQILPGHFITVQGGELISKPYWQPEVSEEGVLSLEDAAAQFRELLQDSVRLRLRSDVPVGTCLSGGLDSSSVVALAADLGQSPKTFSVVYHEVGYDESPFVEEMVKNFHLDAYRVTPDPSGKLLEWVKKITWHMEAPTHDPSVISQWEVMRLAKPHVKVLLDGQGGDELLAGYWGYFRYYFSSLLAQFYRTRNPLWLGRYLSHGAEVAFFLRKRLCANWKRGRNRAAEDQVKWLPALKGPISPLNQALVRDLFCRVLPRLLHYEDRSSMAFSLESRTPFLDHRLVEFCLRLPFHMKIWRKESKRLLRRGLKGDLPEIIVSRRDKLGYPTPFAKWLRGEAGREVVEMLRGAKAVTPGFVESDRIDQMIEEHQNKARDWSNEIWRLVTLEIWYQDLVRAPGSAN